MGTSRLIVNYKGKWKGVEYEGGQSLARIVSTDMKFSELVDLIYELTEMNRNMYDFVIHGVATIEKAALKYSISHNSHTDYFHKKSETGRSSPLLFLLSLLSLLSLAFTGLRRRFRRTQTGRSSPPLFLLSLLSLTFTGLRRRRTQIVVYMSLN